MGQHEKTPGFYLHDSFPNLLDCHLSLVHHETLTVPDLLMAAGTIRTRLSQA